MTKLIEISNLVTTGFLANRLACGQFLVDQIGFGRFLFRLLAPDQDKAAALDVKHRVVPEPLANMLPYEFLGPMMP